MNHDKRKFVRIIWDLTSNQIVANLILVAILIVLPSVGGPAEKPSSSVSLSAKDSTANLTAVRTSIYYFVQDWQLTESHIGFYIENAKGEEILDIEIPTQNAFSHRDGIKDSLLFKDLGIGFHKGDRKAE